MSLISFQRSPLGAFVRSLLGARNNLQGFWLPFETTPENIQISGYETSIAITDGAGYVVISNQSTSFPTKSTLISTDFGKTFIRKELPVSSSSLSGIPGTWDPISWIYHPVTNTYELWVQHYYSGGGQQTGIVAIVFDPVSETWQYAISKVTGNYLLEWDVKEINSSLYAARLEIPGGFFVNGIRLMTYTSSTQHDVDFAFNNSRYLWQGPHSDADGSTTIPIETNGFGFPSDWLISIFQLNNEPYALIFVPVYGDLATQIGLETIVTLLQISTNQLLGFIDVEHGWAIPTSQIGTTGFYFPISVNPEVVDWSGIGNQPMVQISKTEYILFSYATSPGPVTFIHIVDGAFNLGLAIFHNAPSGSRHYASIRYWYDQVNDLLFSVQVDYSVLDVIWVSRDRGYNWYPTSVKLVKKTGTEQGFSQVIGVGNNRYIALGLRENAAIYENTKNTIFSQVPES